MNELVSAVITTYKREPQIFKRALDSVIGQTYKPLEIIVIDDSPQNYVYRNEIRKIIDTCREKICYIQHETSRGACVARNTGLKLAHGKYIAFLDDDDEWISKKIEKQVAAFRDDLALVYCRMCIIDDKTGKKKVTHQKFYEGFVYPKLVCYNFIGSTSFPLIQKSMLEEIGGFDPLMQSSQDHDVWLRLSQKYKISYVDEPLGIYHWNHGTQITKNYEKKLDGMYRIDEKNADFISSDRKTKWSRTIYKTPVYAKNGQLKKALGCWWYAVTIYPLGIKTNIKYLLRLLKGFYCAYIERNTAIHEK